MPDLFMAQVSSWRWQWQMLNTESIDPAIETHRTDRKVGSDKVPWTGDAPVPRQPEVGTQVLCRLK
jgi:hypothetical protein